MNRFTFDVYRTVILKDRVIVEASSLEDARDKAAFGETIGSEFVDEVVSVIDQSEEFVRVSQ